MTVLILLSLLKPFQVSAQQLTEQERSLFENETRQYSDYEVDLLIDEITEAALEAIEQAAGEAAKAAVLEMLEREAIALREAQRWRLEAEANALQITQAKRTGTKNTVIGVLIGILGGLAVGVGGTLIIGGR
jgi:5-methylcytosine-specific restriction endonuclease McrBC GTP-binding regulatory subunit McrB